MSPNTHRIVLIVAAHPDDEVLGCGATIARMVHEGAEVSCCLLGEGPMSRYEDRTQGAQQNDVAGAPSFSQRAAQVLGIQHTHQFQFPDNQFDTVPLLEIVRAVERIKEAMRPDTVFTHCRTDLNIDHRRTYEAVLTACRPVQGETVRAIYSWENPSSTEWQYPNVFQPNLFVDVQTTIEKKVRALHCYETEVRPFPHPRSAEAVRAAAQKWGSVAGLKAAEAFEVIRRIV